MIQLPDFSKAFDYENKFYLSCDVSRMGKIVVHYELYKMTQGLSGALVECGVFKGISLLRFAMFEKLRHPRSPRKIIGLDTFSKFPEAQFVGDKGPREKFIKEAGEESISKEQLIKVLQHKELDAFVELVEGDITDTVPVYIDAHPELKIALVNLDVDIYEPSVTILEHLYPRIVKGGILILDDYGRFPGETKAVDDYFKGQNVEIKKFPFCVTPRYIIKK